MGTNKTFKHALALKKRKPQIPRDARTTAAKLNAEAAAVTCPACGEKIMVAEIGTPDPLAITGIEQNIRCPQCDGFVATMTSFKRVVTYKAPKNEEGA